MGNSIDEQSSRNEMWQRVSRMFKSTIFMSVLATGVSEALAMVPKVASYFHGTDPDNARAWIYIWLVYLVLLPALLMRISKALSGYKPPRHPISARIVLTIFGVVMCSMLVALPAVLLISGKDTVGRAHLAYLTLTNNIVGLALFGGFLVYGVAIAAWILFIGIPKFWIESNEGN